MKIRFFLAVILLGIIVPCSGLKAQYDTLKVMYYNVLDFPNSDPGREVYFRTVNQYLHADVICVNELKSSAGADLILNDALNVYGIDYYQKANYITADFSENLIYFNSNKLGLVSQDVIYTDLRDINEYVLYYKSVDLPVTQDTIYFYFYIAHLKASQGFEQDRLNEVNVFLTHLNSLPNPENVFFGGDFNLYTSAEPAYQALINNLQVNLNDPLPAGNWHSSSTYSDIHTQSTRTIDFGGGSIGGLDDRFDFIIFSDDVNSGSKSVKYITNSCIAFGNDGYHLNKSLIDLPVNPNVPDSVIQALYYGSDHLPVVCDLRVEAVSSSSDSKMVITEIMYNPPEVGMDTLEFIELYNAGATAENLEGFSFSSGVSFTFPAIDVNPGEFVVTAINSAAMLNTFGISALQWAGDGLSNSGEIILLKDNFGRTVDSVYYGDAVPWPEEPDGMGPSLMLCDPFSDNALASNWQASTNFVINNGNGEPILASPGFSECGLPPIADFIASSTTVFPGESVTFTDLSQNEPTSWTWSFPGGNPAVSANQNPSVIYDSPGSYAVSLTASNAFGTDTKTKLDYISVLDNSPTLIITEIMNNPSIVSDAAGEWFEVFNPGNGPVDMDGWIIKDDDTDIHTITGTLIVPAKGFATLGIDANSTTNGGFTCDYQYNNFFLGNSGDEIVLLNPNNDEIDRITYDGGPLWPDPNGSSMVFTGSFSDENNNPSNWIVASIREETYTVASGDNGSPGTNGSDQNLVSPGFNLDIKVFLEGPYNGIEMQTSLSSMPDFPLSQPYNIAPWNYPGTESVSSVPDNEIVDWILVELRDANAASLASGATRIARQAAFLLGNGQIVGMDGISNLHFENTIIQQLFIVIHHRNHLSILSANILNDSGGVYSYDFTTGIGQAYNSGQKNLNSGNYGMISGDANSDGLISDLDKENHWENAAGNVDYNKADLDLDREVNNIDKNEYWYPNRGLGSQVPD